MISNHTGEFVIFDDHSINYEDITIGPTSNTVSLWGLLNLEKLSLLFSGLANDSKVLIQNIANQENIKFVEDCNDKNLIVLTSSGTTGNPKLIAHDKHKFLTKFQRSRKDYKTCLFMPWYHVGGLDTLLYVASNGSSCFVPSNYEPNYFLNAIARHKIQVLAITPSYLNLLMLIPGFEEKLRDVQIITCGAEPFIKSSAVRFMEACPWIKVLQKYGTTETGAFASRTCPEDPSWISFEPNGMWKIKDGTLWVRSGMTCEWVYEDGNIKLSEEWRNTEDLVETREDGYFRILGRQKNLIVVGGQNVHPSEVRSALLNLNEVEDAHIYGKENPLLGQVVAANITTNKIIDKSNIRLKLAKTLSRYKLPVFINIVDQILYTDRHKKIKVEL